LEAVMEDRVFGRGVFSRTSSRGVGVSVGVGVNVEVGVGVAVAVGAGVLVAVGVWVGKRVGVGKGVGIGKVHAERLTMTRKADSSSRRVEDCMASFPKPLL
jgi:hypothetical protein